jgi:hypothetical protein
MRSKFLSIHTSFTMFFELTTTPLHVTYPTLIGP